MWNLKYANSPCNSKERLLIHREHLERLIQVKEKVDNCEPINPIFLKLKANKVQNERDSQHKLNYENNILYSRMFSILKKPSNYNINTYKPAYCPAFDKTKFDWHKRQNKIDLEKKNNKLYARFNSTRSFYPMHQIEQQTDFYQYLERNMTNKNSNPNINYVPYSVFYKKVMVKINKDRICSAKIRSRTGIKRPQSSCSLSSFSSSTINNNNQSMRLYSNKSMKNINRMNINYNMKEMSLIK